MLSSKAVPWWYTKIIMPIFALIQTIIIRLSVAIVAILTAIGLGSVSDSPSRMTVDSTVEQKTEEIAGPVDEIPIEPKEAVFIPEIYENKNEGLPKTEVIENQEIETNNEATFIKNLSETKETTQEIIQEELPISFSQINSDTSKALVNILCSQNVATSINPITGSGVIIDPRGVVITNAHVAQSFLLQDFPIENSLSCILRTGSPARSMYTAELLYISPEWVSLHAHDIKNPEPKGTGEHDYAFLRITGRTDMDTEIQKTFPFIPFEVNSNIKKGDQALVSAYPAGFLGSSIIQKDLYSLSSVAIVGDIFTFIENTIDLFSVGGTVVSQGGSSGGAVVSEKNKLIGIIVTSTKAETTSERDLRAITIDHIDRSLIKYENINIDGLLFGDIELKSKIFNFRTAPILRNLYLEYLEK